VVLETGRSRRLRRLRCSARGAARWLPMTCGCQSYSWGTLSPYRTVDDSFC